MRHIITDIVRSIEPIDALEQRHRRETLDWIDAGHPLFRVAKPATPPTHLVSYFLLCDVSERKVLLVDHIDAGLWLPSGGHVEPEEHPRETVRREVAEELFITKALKRQGKFIIIPHPVITSARKFRTYTPRELLGAFAKLLTRGPKSWKTRQGAPWWYDARREDHARQG